MIRKRPAIPQASPAGSAPSMPSLHRRPQIEEGKHNIILQNRAGSRLTMMFNEDGVELEFVYKPSAFRRKDFRARNFSTRDNLTTLFADAALPEIKAGYVQQFDYDPFMTSIDTLAPGGARNRITVINIADENVFALTAANPLTLSFTPHAGFTESEGLLYEEFSDRGEDIVSFIAFPGQEQNRYRLIAGGRRILQIMQGDVVLIGGEENTGQVTRILKELSGISADELADRGEAAISYVTSRARVQVNDSDIQRIVDLNRRIVYSGLDEGGACFGALNRIYHLIWARDGAMTASQFAMAGNPEFIKIWAPFMLANPSHYAEHGGRSFPEYLQMVGSRWTKSEDDGLYYAALTLFNHYRATADDSILRFAGPMITATDYHIESRWDEEHQMFGSDTLGETTLSSSALFGYDAVNGTIAADRNQDKHGDRRLAYTYSLYHNTNMYNVLCMMQTLLYESDGEYSDVIRRYDELGKKVADSIRTRFTDPDTGIFRSHFSVFDDSSTEWTPFERGDYWEHAWAVSAPPFFPDMALALKSARHVRRIWPEVRSYGYCPWNTLSALLTEFGMTSEEFKSMHKDQIDEALITSVKYPMKGGLTEYFGNPEGWRCLPFSAATFINAVTGQIIKGLPLGVAVRGGALAESISNYTYRAALIDAAAHGPGDTVESVSVNGRPLSGTLQIPEARLRTGRNRIDIRRGSPPGQRRLFYSSARLFDVAEDGERLVYDMSSAVRTDLVFENMSDAAPLVLDTEGRELHYEKSNLEGSDMALLRIPACGAFKVIV